jgi:hypothetical protein
MKTMSMVVWLVIVAVIGVCGLDGYSIMTNRVHTENAAQAAALAASQAYQADSLNLPAAYAAAKASVAAKGDTVLTTGFTVDPNYTIHLVLQHTVHTVACGHIGFCRHLTVATEHGDAGYTPNG